MGVRAYSVVGGDEGTRGAPRQIALATLAMALAALLVTLGLASPARASSRIKDIADFEGVRENMLVGYGLVVGLNGTGDTLTNAAFTKQSLVGMLERLGVNTRDAIDTLKTDNVAAVMVTATLPAFSRQGTRIDVAVAALGDAKSLLGGTLLVTPLIGADGEVYAVAQGQVAVARLLRPGRRRVGHQGRADQRAHRQRRHRRARDRLRAGQHAAASASRCATPTSPPPGASPRRSTASSAARPPRRPTRHRHGRGARRTTAAAWSRC